MFHKQWINVKRILKGQSKMENPDKLATYDTEDKEEHNIKSIYVGHHNTQTNLNNEIRHEPSYEQLEVVFMQKS